ncbi:MAG: putative rane transporter protein [Pedosphaera sp.]|nr:putative rane transporter protein [Pedosphaera sp.]
MNAMSAYHLPPWTFAAFFGTGLVAGFVDSIAGGGGLITLPVLLSIGLPPQVALGTNKLQATFGSGSAAWHHTQSGVVSLAACWQGVLFTAIGGVAGTLLVQRLDPNFLKQFIPVILLVIVGYVLFKPQLGATDLHPRMTRGLFYFTAGLTLGFYDGFLGPGTGSFWTMAFMLGLGFNLTKATGYTKVMNFTSNLVSFALFAMAGHVYYAAGFSMGAGQLIGAKIGSGMVVKRGAKFIRPIFIAMVLAITLRLLYGAYQK